MAKFEINMCTFRYYRSSDGIPMYDVWITVDRPEDLPVPAPQNWLPGSHAEILSPGSAPVIAGLNSDGVWCYEGGSSAREAVPNAEN